MTTRADNAHDHDHESDHGECAGATLARAETICSERGLRLTPLRRQVLEIICESSGAVGAYDILAQLAERGAHKAPPTVYRVLEFLLEARLIHRLDSLNAYIGCSAPGVAHTAQFLICQTCNSVQEMEDQQVSQAIQAVLGQTAFSAEQVTLEVKGICGDCRQRARR
ncbi:MAG: Fur family transcriptional regulator [Pseudomonadota bacterium]